MDSCRQKFNAFDVTAYELVHCVLITETNDFYKINFDDYFMRFPNHLITCNNYDDAADNLAFDEDDTLNRGSVTGDVLWRSQLAQISDRVKHLRNYDVSKPHVNKRAKRTRKILLAADDEAWFRRINFQTEAEWDCNVLLQNYEQFSMSSHFKNTEVFISGFDTRSRASSTSSQSCFSDSSNKESSIQESNTGCYFPATYLIDDDVVVRYVRCSQMSVFLWLVPSTSAGANEENNYGTICLYDFSTRSHRLQSLTEWTYVSKTFSHDHSYCLLLSNALAVPAFSVTKEEIINNMILYDNPVMAENLSRLNGWDHCSIPIYVLELGLQHHRLDVITLFLKNRKDSFTYLQKDENWLSNSTESASASHNTKRVTDYQQIITAVDMLIKAIETSMQDHHLNFGRHLLKLTMDFVNGLIRDGMMVFETAFSDSKTGKTDEELPIRNLLSAVTACADRIVSLRSYLTITKSDVTDSAIRNRRNIDKLGQQDSTTWKKWLKMNREGILQDAVLSRHIPLAQAFLIQNMGNGLLVNCLAVVRSCVLEFLLLKDLEKVEDVLTNMGFNPRRELKDIMMNTLDRSLRDFLISKLSERRLLTESEGQLIAFAHIVEKYYPFQSFKQAKETISGITNISDDEIYSRIATYSGELKEESYFHVYNFDGSTPIFDGTTGGYLNTALEWMVLWSNQDKEKILLECALKNNLQTDIARTVSIASEWTYYVDHHMLSTLQKWISQLYSQFEVENEIAIGDRNDTDKSIDVLAGRSLSTELWNNIACTPLIYDAIMDKLASFGIYRQRDKMAFRQLLYRITKVGRLFCTLSPFQDKESKELIEFHKSFANYCIANNLPNILYHYLDYYDLDGTRDLEIKKIVKESSINWLNALISFRKVGKNNHNLSLLLAASLSNAELCLDVNSSSISNMLESNRPLMALATCMYAPVAINDLLVDLESFQSSTSSSYTCSKSLLIDSIVAYPTLSKVLNPQDIPYHEEPKDVTMYQLLQGNAPFDLARILSFQSAASVWHSSDQLGDIPHFSSPPLVQKHAFRERLDFSYFLRSCRPSFAFLAFISSFHNNNLKLEKVHLAKAASRAYRIAMKEFEDNKIAYACAAFTEMLGISSRKLRIDIESAKVILSYRKYNFMTNNSYGYKGKFVRDNLTQSDQARITDQFLACFGFNGKVRAISVLSELENAISYKIKKEGQKSTSYAAMKQWRLAVAFCRAHEIPLSTLFLIDCAICNEWLPFFCFVQQCQYPSLQVIKIIKQYFSDSNIKEHLLLAINNIRTVELKRKDSAGKGRHLRHKKRNLAHDRKRKLVYTRDPRQPFYFKIGVKKTNTLELGSMTTNAWYTATSGQVTDNPADYDQKLLIREQAEGSDQPLSGVLDTDSDVASPPDDLFEVVFHCQSTGMPYRSLLAYAIFYQRPLLAILAGSYNDSYVSVDCICSYLYAIYGNRVFQSIDRQLFGSDRACFSDVLQNDWQPEHLCIILLTAMEKKQFFPYIVKAFRIFDPDCPFLAFLKFCESFYFDCDETASTSYFLEFIELSRLTKEGLPEENIMDKKYIRDTDWMMNTASQMIDTMLKLCETSYELHFLLRILKDVEVENNNKAFEGQDYKFMYQVFTLIVDAGVDIDILALVPGIADIVNSKNETERVINKFLELKLFDKARELAELLDFSKDITFIAEILYEILDLSQTNIWLSVDTRLTFWENSRLYLKDRGCTSNVICKFFKDFAIGQCDYKFISLPEVSWLHPKEQAILMAISIEWLFEFSNEVPGNEQKSAAQRQRIISDVAVKAWKYLIAAKLKDRNGDCLSAEFVLDISQRIINSLNSVLDNCVTDERIDIFRPIEEYIVFKQTKSATFLQRESERTALESFIGHLLSANRIREACYLCRLFHFESQDLNVIWTCLSLARGELSPDGIEEDMKKLLNSSPILKQKQLSIRTGVLINGEMLTSDDIISSEQDKNIIMTIGQLINHCESGRNCCERIMIRYMLAMGLKKEYSIVATEDNLELLKQLMMTSLVSKFSLASEYVRIFNLSNDQATEFVSDFIIETIKAYANHGFVVDERHSYIFNPEWSFKEFQSIAKICRDPSFIGNNLLNTAKETIGNDKISATDISIIVELLIRSHDCYTSACSMDGIAKVLRVVKRCTNKLSQLQMYKRMIRLLIGIGRYREMSYIIDILLQSDQFEILMSRLSNKAKNFRVVILEYLKRNYPEDREKYSMAALRFSMHREIGDTLREMARKILRTLKRQGIENKPNAKQELKCSFQYFTDAAKEYSKEGCYRMAQQCAMNARLVDVQIRLLEFEIPVIGLSEYELHKFMVNHKNFFEALVVAQAYKKHNVLDWSSSILEQVIRNGNFKYFQDFRSAFAISNAFYQDLSKKYLQFIKDKPLSSALNNNMRLVINFVKEIKLRYELSVELGLTDIVKELLNSHNGAFIKDTCKA
ncbi:uncharacterized protein TRIADDRAFT_54370 [Trichoplax adhaerens]|uniref:Spatacsin C-terminal domain-containing protein n=1 Tax=Trichoplax adhaerens TaxID=10228 RepID=B3RRU5_TRIAD|nr:hypothetical protein TRIADDRAFT_54370 [Trichoplax adhaerens]EDV26932.1 hypothetical protein TRIADDRAFT_54370 [Trichoplax adhaerens]|eukprot:XP_002110928.1 hypothetical protein TRIADDRAFT_54370 [Trichoplax adhaerens]